MCPRLLSRPHKLSSLFLPLKISLFLVVFRMVRNWIKQTEQRTMQHALRKLQSLRIRSGALGLGLTAASMRSRIKYELS